MQLHQALAPIHHDNASYLGQKSNTLNMTLVPAVLAQVWAQVWVQVWVQLWVLVLASLAARSNRKHNHQNPSNLYHHALAPVHHDISFYLAPEKNTQNTSRAPRLLVQVLVQASAKALAQVLATVMSVLELAMQ